MPELGALQDLLNGYRTLQYIRWCQGELPARRPRCVLTAKLAVSGLAIIFYDYVLTLNLEIRYIWKATGICSRGHFLFLRTLFLLNRYLPILTQVYNTIGALDTRISDKFCQVFLRDILALTSIVEWFGVPAAIVCYRTCALYGRRRGVILALVAAYIAVLIATTIIVIVYVHGDHVTAELAPDINFKVASSTFSTTLRSMAWHTIAYCCIIGAADLTNMLIYATAPNEMRHLFDGVMFSLVSVLCSRLLLHMRELGDREKTDFFTETDGTELSTLRDLRAMPNAYQWQAKVPGRSYGYF